MQVSFEEFSRRLDALRERIAAACNRCGRDPEEVRIMAVTKTHPLEAAAWAMRAGVFAVGENRIQEAVEKIDRAAFSVRWELIGHLQSNKAKLAVHHFARVQTVDSGKLVTVLEREASRAGRTLPVLLQVNAGKDPAKFGVECDEAGALLDGALGAKHLAVEGLMTIAPLADDGGATARRAFARLRELRDTLETSRGTRLAELSMGMTDDLEAAVEEGTTLVRVGSALFGKRER